MSICQIIRILIKIIRGLWKPLKKSIMYNANQFRVKSHLTTSNLYVQKTIIVENIDSINKTLNNRIGLNLRNSQYREIIKLKKRQYEILKSINNKIRDIEQHSFPFGNPLSDLNV